MGSAAPAAAIDCAARGIFHDLAPEVPIKLSPFGHEMGGWLANRRFPLLLVGIFAVAAQPLAAAGVTELWPFR